MNIILIGPQGSGKGTQARILCEKFNFFYFESGAYLRRVAETNREIKKAMDEGKLVADEEMTSYLTAYLDSKHLYDDIIFDGFPRTVEQYRFLRGWLAKKNVRVDMAIDLTISEAETVRRLSARRLDSATGKIYNLITDPPPAGIDSGKLVQREDDRPEAIEERLRLYNERTRPLVSELEKEIEVIKVDGERPIEVIAKDLESIVSERSGK
ncbi:MAG TPA: nucleoside monophosphate kinase [Patescibacteria group bacterium]|nr:nucleoside monophosphate kinase [Patescibacteria group bacterium]